jgi:hypothetical protein
MPYLPTVNIPAAPLETVVAAATDLDTATERSLQGDPQP